MTELVCTEVFDRIIVVAQYSWIGTKEENPQENSLPIPEDLFSVYFKKNLKKYT